MSAFQVVGSSAFPIFSDNSENGDPGFKKAKMDTELDRGTNTRRTALGNITNNTRVQPLRAAKQVFCMFQNLEFQHCYEYLRE